mmetsp:Transcript_2055/g.3632  ORF Transcript_2055/g.3632 Transcript_2055/m.3632 type:complete len:98 (+) Transcript_2055:137-430(+)|eukprot:CAMPEP_0168611248 /NCGR_PEP_ID=MMETSP0449_2-20121227/2255_1 /TAXON_ID=1082188 /ORGANISM="Strombidium rassoulzadegani, Strain ras09" /LENGTH=97 /DNA_ID=CAMNT_0008651679 /DNA_START=63 /DNA_END=356 /DNA_ORIENTATION=+
MDPSFEEQGLLLFEKVFDMAPELKKLFKFADYPPVEYELELRKHSSGVFKAVDKSLQQIGTEIIAPRLQALGSRHKDRGIAVGHYAIIGKSLLLTLE